MQEEVRLQYIRELADYLQEHREPDAAAHLRSAADRIERRLSSGDVEGTAAELEPESLDTE